MDNMIGIDIRPDIVEPVDEALIERAASAALDLYGPKQPLELSIVITTDAEIRNYNLQYLGRDRATDVIAFGTDQESEQDAFVAPLELPRYLGDIMISYERAVEQAPDYEHTAAEELHQLVAHGVLHLLGYNDSTDEQRAEMRRMERNVLGRLGER